MSQSTFILLTLFVIVCMSWRIDAMKPAGTQPKAMTPKTVCELRRHEDACSDTSDNLCSNLRCRDLHGFVSSFGKAPDNMWCAERKMCKNGVCSVHAPGYSRSPLFTFKSCPETA